MANKSAHSTALPGSHVHSWLVPHRIGLIILWLIVTIAMSVMLWLGVRDTNRFNTARYLLLAGYAAALLWYLARSGPSISQLPEILPLARWRYASWIPVPLIGLILALMAISDDGFALLILLMIAAVVPILVAWRREVSLCLVIQGIVVSVIAFVAGMPMMINGFVNEGFGHLITILAIPMYIAGGLLLGHTGLGGIYLLAKQYLPALRSFLWGCLLFVPLGLANAASESPAGSSLVWVRMWWMPFSLPLWSGIVEETWFRLFLVGLAYYLLRPVFQKRPALAILATVLFSGITFGLGHGRTLDNFLATGLLYGVPFAVTFARRDWEHAVGAHYMVNMISWVMVFLEK